MLFFTDTLKDFTFSTPPRKSDFTRLPGGFFLSALMTKQLNQAELAPIYVTQVSYSFKEY
tara:strand:- start:540 stop:719 length:180 start_codon:yes stop_codon:yes gene_type:complete